MSVNVAVVGATGAVGEAMIEILEERDFPVGELFLLASERSEGKRNASDCHHHSLFVAAAGRDRQAHDPREERQGEAEDVEVERVGGGAPEVGPGRPPEARQHRPVLHHEVLVLQLRDEVVDRAAVEHGRELRAVVRDEGDA